MPFATKEEIEKVIEKIREEEPIIIVEGAKDKRALEAFQIKNITILNGKDIWNRMEQTVEKNRKETRERNKKSKNKNPNRPKGRGIFNVGNPIDKRIESNPTIASDGVFPTNNNYMQRESFVKRFKATI